MYMNKLCVGFVLVTLTLGKHFIMLQNPLGFFLWQEAEALTQPAGHWPKNKESVSSLPVWIITALVLMVGPCY